MRLDNFSFYEKRAKVEFEKKKFFFFDIVTTTSFIGMIHMTQVSLDMFKVGGKHLKSWKRLRGWQGGQQYLGVCIKKCSQIFLQQTTSKPIEFGGRIVPQKKTQKDPALMFYGKIRPFAKCYQKTYIIFFHTDNLQFYHTISWNIERFWSNQISI